MNMISGWFEKPVQKIGFEDLQYAIQHTPLYLIINTLPITEQKCLIKNTMSYDIEESTLNDKITTYQTNKCVIIVYGRNSADSTVDKKYRQLISLGFRNVYVYYGGMFEWLLLQDIYGINEFPTTDRELDILKFKAHKTFDILRIGF